MLEDDCPTCGTRRSYKTCIGNEKRRFPRGKLECQFVQFNWHQQLENLKRDLDLARTQTIKTIIQQEMETIILEHCPAPFDLQPSTFDLRPSSPLSEQP